MQQRQGNDYIRFLLDEEFSPKRVHKKVERDVVLDVPEETHDETLFDDDNDESSVDDIVKVARAELPPDHIRNYVDSLKSSVVYWFKSFYPAMVDGVSEEERLWLERLNRLGVVYFRPLIMSILKNVTGERLRVGALRHIERFIFIVFRLSTATANYQSSIYYNAARELDKGALSVVSLLERLDGSSEYLFWDDDTFDEEEFYTVLAKKFKNGRGYYGWSGLRYFLYEYELELLSNSRQKKVSWESLLKTGKDKISIEHIYPQTESEEWEAAFQGLSDVEKRNYSGSLGNLLLLSASINSSLQNDGFSSKKKPKYDGTGNKLRNGYSDGSHSEIKVSESKTWGRNHIQKRGMQLLAFMEKRWEFEFNSSGKKKRLLFLDVEKERH